MSVSNTRTQLGILFSSLAKLNVSGNLPAPPLLPQTWKFSAKIVIFYVLKYAHLQHFCEILSLKKLKSWTDFSSAVFVARAKITSTFPVFPVCAEIIRKKCVNYYSILKDETTNSGRILYSNSPGLALLGNTVIIVILRMNRVPLLFLLPLLWNLNEYPG